MAAAAALLPGHSLLREECQAMLQWQQQQLPMHHQDHLQQ